MAAEYRVELNGRWKLEDLYIFPHAFSQTYAFTYCFDSDLDPRDAERIEIALQTYPWGGGYSYVNIYKVLQTQVPVRDRPTIASIHYGSPGWLDILLNTDVAIQVAKSVGILLGTAVAAAESYKKIYKTLSEINSLRRKRELEKTEVTQAQLKSIVKTSELIAKYVGFGSLKELHDRTGSAEIRLRVLLAHYRRLKILLEFVQKHKATLPEKRKEDD